jgi:hypothetical protein
VRAMPLATASRRRAPGPDDPTQAGDRRPRVPWPTAAGRSPRPVLAAAGVLIVVVCAAIGASVAGRSRGGTPYLAVARAVPAGTPIGQADLSVVDLDPASGLVGIPASAEAGVLGERATTSLAPGTLLVAADVTAAPPVPKGDAVVGASLAPDQLPSEVQPGDPVLVVLTTSSGLAGAGVAPAPASGPVPGQGGVTRSAGQPGAAGDVIATGTVIDVAATGSVASPGGSASSVTIVSLAVPVAVAAEVTAASAANQLSLALVAGATVPARETKS